MSALLTWGVGCTQAVTEKLKQATDVVSILRQYLVVRGFPRESHSDNLFIESQRWREVR